MTRRWTVTWTMGAWLTLGGLWGVAAVTAGEPTTKPAATAPAPTAKPTKPDPAAEKVLDALEARGNTLEDLEANVDYTKIDELLDDKQKYKGVLRFKKAQPNPVFFVRFDRRIHEERVRREKQWHIFDGRWYWEAREKTQTINKREIVAPGEKTEVFRLGEGPFPLPFGQKKADILAHFTVKLLPAGPEAPPKFKGSHLELTPIPGTKMAKKYDAIHFYVDQKLRLPIRVRTTDKEEDRELLVDFVNVKINPRLRPAAFELPAKVRSDYRITEERLERAGRGKK